MLTLVSKIRGSITAKICISILVIETVLLSLMGIYYINRFWHQIDRRVTEKMALPGIMIVNRALNFESVTDFNVLEEILDEKVIDAFITKSDGTIYYSKDIPRIGRSFSQYLVDVEKFDLSEGLEKNLYFTFSKEGGQDYRSIVSPLNVQERLVGLLYIRISSDRILEEKYEILFLFIAGSFAMIFLTTLLEAFWVRTIFVPPINKTLSGLKKVQNGDLSARIDGKGVDDQLGKLIGQINSMIAAIERNYNNLVLLNWAGKFLSRAQDRGEVENGANVIVDEYISLISGKGLKKTGNDPDLVISLSGPDVAGQIRKIVCDMDIAFAEFGVDEFAKALAELINNAMRRIMGGEKIRIAERKYRSMFAEAIEGIFRTTQEGTLLDVNPAMAQMAGYDSPEEMIRLCKDLAQQHYSNPEDRRSFLDKLEQQGEVREFEFQMLRRDGTTHWVSITAHGVKDESGKIVAIEGRINDINERKLKESAEFERQVAEASAKEKTELLKILEKKNKELQKALEELKTTQSKLIQSEKMMAIGMTIGGVAHDLNNILSGVINYPEIQLMTLPEDSEHRRPYELIMASGRRAAAIVDDLLTLTRGVMQNKEITSFNKLIDEYRQSIEFDQLLSDHPDVNILWDQRAVSSNIDCSPAHIHKVLMNLMTNAIEAVSGSGTVRVMTEDCLVGPKDVDIPDLDPGPYVRISVIDDGPGISAEDISHIFEPFYTKKVMGRSGTGLGLTIVMNAVAEHGGSVRVKSSKNGTTFVVYLPRNKKAVEDVTDRLKPENLEGTGTILVVDDEPMQRDIARTTLESFGYSVDTVTSGEEALVYLSENQVDLLLLDMLMPPGMNGYEVFKEVIKVNPSQRAIIISGYSQDEDVKKALALGVRGFLKKPYSSRGLGLAVYEEIVKN